MRYLFVILLYLGACSPLNDTISEEVHNGSYVNVIKVIDGDTFWVKDGEISFKVRLIGVDAPEVRNSRYKKKGYFGVESKDYVTMLTLDQRVRLEYDVQKKDRYGRQLAYVFLQDGTLLNADLVAKGYAVVDTYPPNIKYVEKFIELQRAARLEELGVWTQLDKSFD